MNIEHIGDQPRLLPKLVDYLGPLVSSVLVVSEEVAKAVGRHPCIDYALLQCLKRAVNVLHRLSKHVLIYVAFQVHANVIQHLLDG